MKDTSIELESNSDAETSYMNAQEKENRLKSGELVSIIKDYEPFWICEYENTCILVFAGYRVDEGKSVEEYKQICESSEWKWIVKIISICIDFTDKNFKSQMKNTSL